MSKTPGLLVFGCLLAGNAVAVDYSDFDCIIEPHSVTDVGTREAGVLETVLVKRGDIVNKGQELARLESSVEQVAVELARARTKMSGTLSGKKEAVSYLNRQKKRIDELYKKKSVSFHEKDQASTDLLLAQMDLRDARETMDLARIELKRAERALSRRTILSPTDGVVVKVLQLPGESVEERPIITVARIDPLNVEVILPVRRMDDVKLGGKARVLPEYPGAQAVEATVQIIDRVVDAASNTLGARLELANPDYAIPGGIRCQVEFLDPAR